MLINKANVAGVMTNIKTTFNKALDESKPLWSKVASKVPSTGAQNDYTWIKAGWPSLRRWIGEKQVKNLEGAKYTISNEAYESTIAVKRDDLEDDNYGIYAAIARSEGQAAALWPDEMVAELVNGAFTGVCYDGKAMCATDHPMGSTTGGNKTTKVLSCATLAKAQDSYGAARTAMMSLKNDAGRPLNIVPNVLLVPPALEATARTLMLNDRLEDGKPNPYKGSAEVVVWPMLTSTTAWFLLDNSKPLLPFIYQERKKPTPVAQVNPDSDEVFSLGVYRFSIEARGAAGYAFWQLLHGSDGSVA